ncbi:MAG: SpoIIE family protein phosphatase [Thermodesulfobacteriota bacterium]
MTEPEPRFNGKIRTRMLVPILGSAAAVLLVLGYTLYTTARQMVKEQVAASVIGHLTRGAESVDAWLRQEAALVNALALLLEEKGTASPAAVAASLTAFGQRFETKVPFVGLESGVYIDPAWTPEPGYDHRQRTWYQETRAEGGRSFSEPYRDGDTGEMIVTLGFPLRQDGLFTGVVALDVFPAHVLAQLRTAGREQSLEAFVVDKSGRYIAHPDESFILQKRIQDGPFGRAFEGWLASGKASLIAQDDAYLAFSPIASAGWTVAFRINQAAVDGPARRLTLFFALGAATALTVLAVVIILICQFLSRPILTLAEGAARVAGGDYDYRASIPTRDELGFLAHSFNQMTAGLAERERIRSELAESRAQQARIEGELQAGHDIQLAMLPREMPALAAFRPHAFYKSAKEVGGDFYDLFPLPDGRYALVVGDVSGKGVPAALFMAITCSALRVTCPERPDPAAAMAACNDLLAAHNEEGMFVTLFIAYYDPPTGECIYANGGHTEPLVLRVDGGLRTVPTLKDMVVGPFPGLAFNTGTFTLAPGEVCLIYTDGVTEAHAPGGGLFGEAALMQLIEAQGSRDPAALCETIQSAVMEFQKGDQFDDITLLAWQRQP